MRGRFSPIFYDRWFADGLLLWAGKISPKNSTVIWP